MSSGTPWNRTYSYSTYSRTYCVSCTSTVPCNLIGLSWLRSCTK